ncbi:cell division protein ZapE [Methylonatrum kenyense]|uniref:cell division protein ZapE n=1 Tax=Methylonatrum kenyense TaxID=455253 RepID=UPI0020C0163F|nr:cell division protein ZapE [Methylonatrum kenyense]MCK8516656.1 cell division protein ZapE [Methylonatrum kenyense]
MTPKERYQVDLQRPDFIDDPAQALAVEVLDDLHQRLVQQPTPDSGGWLRGLLGRKQPREGVQGLYLWGGVGRGKTYLMDTFFESLPFEHKQRLHFHRFMQMVHADLKVLPDTPDPLEVVAERFAARVRVLCFDEFFVSDITDAMMLGRLLAALFRRGITLVATSNVEPKDLYKDGLQREQFLPVIDLLDKHTRVLHLDSATDYRLRYLEQAETWHTPVNAETSARLAEEFERLGMAAEPKRNVQIDVNGRSIPALGIAEDVIWFDFKTLVDGPRSAQDYIEIAREFHTVLLSDVPVLTAQRENDTRRFISMVDEFYDRNVKLIISADASPQALYQGARLRFEYERTRSRLEEMQSTEYLARPHRL